MPKSKNIKIARQLTTIKDPQLGIRENDIFSPEGILLGYLTKFQRGLGLDDSVVLMSVT